MKTLSFGELLTEVKNAQIGFTRVTDIEAGEYNIDIVNPTKENEEPRIYLVDKSNKAKRYSITANGLASMRIVDSAATAQVAKTTLEARTAAGYENLQAVILNETPGKSITKDSTFQAVHQLKVVDGNTGAQIFKNQAYTGFPAYQAEAAKIRPMPTGPDKLDAYNKASAVLRATAVAADKNNDKWHIHMPVFVVK
jgi:hypothetical protein